MIRHDRIPPNDYVARFGKTQEMEDMDGIYLLTARLGAGGGDPGVVIGRENGIAEFTRQTLNDQRTRGFPIQGSRNSGAS